MKLKVHNINGDVTGEVEVSDSIFATEPNHHLIAQVVRWQQAKRHRGTHAAKTRSQVSGSTKKQYRQKGTGRARIGNGKSNVHVGGGVAFGPKVHSYDFKVNRKARAGALRHVLSQKVTDDKLVIVDGFELEDIKTKGAVTALTRLGANRALVVDGDNRNLNLSVRNLAGHDYLNVAGLNIYDMLKHDSLVLTTRALSEVEGRLAL
jgi:large subunit ribosomal protein L4